MLMSSLAPKSYVTPLNNHLDLRNVVVLSMVPLVSLDTKASTSTETIMWHDFQPQKCSGVIKGTTRIMCCWCWHSDACYGTKSHVTPLHDHMDFSSAIICAAGVMWCWHYDGSIMMEQALRHLKLIILTSGMQQCHQGCCWYSMMLMPALWHWYWY